MNKPKTKASVQLTNKLAAYIERNSKFFVADNSFSAARFAQRFRNFQFLGDPSTISGAATFVVMQSKLNKLLALRGLKLKSRKYYSQWYFESTIKDVHSFERKAMGYTTAAMNLRRGINTYKGAITPYDAAEKERVAAHIYRNPINGNRS